MTQGKAATTADLKAALLQRYSGEAWALFWEVPDATGRDKMRTADAIAMSLWPSRGLVLHGHELKASRADWLKELKQPEKAESICRFCDHWWIVAGPDVVRDGELPPTWGLIVLNGRGLVQTVAAPALTPQPIDRMFLAGLLRAATKTAAKDDQAVIRAARNAGYQEGLKAATKPSGDDLRLEKLTEAVASFEKASGVSIHHWSDNTDAGRRVKEVIENDKLLLQSRRELGEVKRCSARLVELLKEPTE